MLTVLSSVFPNYIVFGFQKNKENVPFRTMKL